MAVSWTCPFPYPPSLQLQSHDYSAIPKTLISKNLIPNTLPPNNCCSSSNCVLLSNRYQSLRRVCSGSGSTTNNSISSIESHDSPSIGVFIKGLPESVMEGRLKKVFSQFGEVSQVKVVIEKKFMQPLGSAFVWFTSKESAHLAVEQMNGKFFDGRFILVKIAEPKLSKSRGRSPRYKF